MALSDVQVGVIGQMEFIKLGTMGSKGALDYDSPFADDDRRDHEIHRRGRFGPGLAVQTKVRLRLYPHDGGLRLHITILVPALRVVSSRMFWYFFAYLDPATMRVAEPCFLIPSAIVHRRCRKKAWRGYQRFVFIGAMGPESRDQWVPYRVSPTAVGSRLLEIIAALPAVGLAAGPAQTGQRFPGSVIVRRRTGAGP